MARCAGPLAQCCPQDRGSIFVFFSQHHSPCAPAPSQGRPSLTVFDVSLCARMNHIRERISRASRIACPLRASIRMSHHFLVRRRDRRPRLSCSTSPARSPTSVVNISFSNFSPATFFSSRPITVHTSTPRDRANRRSKARIARRHLPTPLARPSATILLRVIANPPSLPRSSCTHLTFHTLPPFRPSGAHTAQPTVPHEIYNTPRRTAPVSHFPSLLCHVPPAPTPPPITRRNHCPGQFLDAVPHESLQSPNCRIH